MGELKSWQKGFPAYPRSFNDFPIDPTTTTLLLVDMQYYDASPDYGIGLALQKTYPDIANYLLPRIKIVIANFQKLLEFFRKNNLRVFYVSFGASMPDASDMLPLRKMKSSETPAFTTADFEYQILDELKPAPGELVVSKATRCAFIGTGLDHTLRMMSIDTIAIGGTVDNACVESTARGASDCGYNTILINDACASWTEQDHNATMKTFHQFFGMVLDTDELIVALSQKL